MNGINLDFKSNISKTISDIKKFTTSWSKLGGVVKTTNSGFASSQKQIKKLNTGFNNITRDSNRATGGIKKLNGSFLSMGNAIRAIGIYQLARGLSTAISSAMDMIETANLFSVAMGTLAIETNKVVVGWSKLTGLDTTNIQNSVGTFGALSKSMGMTAKASQQLSTTTYRLGLDLASLYNVSIEQALGDLRSGLVGQSETMYKYGVDVTEASLKVEALNQGLTKSVRNMSQGEKMALRYAVMLRQTSVAQGDFARTIEQPANQLRILKERFTTLTRTIGTVFIPILAKILPYLNAIVQVLNILFARLASLFGYTDDMANIFDFGGTGGVDTVDDLEEGLSGASDEAKKLKGQLMGFDEINLWTPPDEDTSSGSSSGTGAIAGGVDMSWMEDLTYDSGFDTIKTKSQEMAQAMIKSWDSVIKATDNLKTSLINLWNEGFSVFGNFVWDSLKGFYENFLLPVGSWVLGKGLPDFVNIINNGLQKIDWGKIVTSLDNLWKVLAPYSVNVGKGLLWLFENALVPLSSWAIDTLFPEVINTLTSVFELLGIELEAIRPTMNWIWEDILIPMGNWAGTLLLNTLKEFQEHMKNIGEWIEKHQVLFDTFVTVVFALSTAIFLVVKGFKAFIAIKSAIETASLILGIAMGSISLTVGLVVLAIGAVIAIGVLLWKHWEDIGIWAKQWWKDNTEEISKTWTTLKENWARDMDAIVEFWKQGWTKISTWAKSWWDENTTEMAKFTGNFKKNWSKSMDGISELWEKAWIGIGNFFIGIANSISSAFESMINGIIGMINSLNGLVNSIFKAFGSDKRITILADVKFNKLDFLESVGYKPSQKPVLQYASGGMPDYGEMFVAREAGAELVGNIGGKTGVMNNDQIVEAVSAGVYSAVSSAMNISGGNNNQDKEVILEIDGTKLGRILLPKMNKESKRLGYKPILADR